MLASLQAHTGPVALLTLPPTLNSKLLKLTGPCFSFTGLQLTSPSFSFSFNPDISSLAFPRPHLFSHGLETAGHVS